MREQVCQHPRSRPATHMSLHGTRSVAPSHKCWTRGGERVCGTPLWFERRREVEYRMCEEREGGMNVG